MSLRGILSSVSFGPQRVSKKILAVSEALYMRTEQGHGPLEKPKGAIAVLLGDRAAGAHSARSLRATHKSSKPRPPAGRWAQTGPGVRPDSQ